MATNVEPVAATAPAAASRVSKSTVESAISALLKYKAAQSTTQKLQLLPQDDYIYLNLTLKKIPSNSRTNPFKIPLAHPILGASSQLCLIIDDRPKSTTPPSDQMKKLIKSQDIPISKVIKISKLKTNYKPFEAKRKLCDSYDLFLVDKSVVHLLPKLIGKQFFKKKKLPLGVDLRKKNLKLQVERALGSALLYVRTGTCCVMKIGKVEMEKDEIVENVFDAIKGAVERVPKKWDGVRSLHLKFCDSVALPIYQTMPDVKLKIEGLKEIEERTKLVKVSDNEGDFEGKIGSKEGKRGKKKKKGRIHEVRYMDVGRDVDSDDDDMDNDEFVGKKGMEEHLIEKSDDDEGDADEMKKNKEEEELIIDGDVGKKGKKDKASKKKALGVMNGEKPVKNKVKPVKNKVKPEKTVVKKTKKGTEKDLIEESNDDEGNADERKKNDEEELTIDGNVGKKRKEDRASKKKASGVMKGEKLVKNKVKSEKTVVKKPKKGAEENAMIEENDDDEDNADVRKNNEEELTIDGNVGKKRKQDKASKKKALGVMNGKNLVKKKAKPEKAVVKKAKKGMKEDLIEESDDDEGNADDMTKTKEDELSIDGTVGKKRKNDKASKMVMPEKTVVKKHKKYGLPSNKEPAEVKGKKKTERVVKKRA